jgi:hypothetical protein
MPPVEVGPLSEEAAIHLAGGLLMGANVACSDLGAVARETAEASSRVPFYIQHAARYMADRPGRPGTAWGPNDAKAVPEALFDANGDPAEFGYYESRLGTHYPDDVAERSRVVLDVLSKSAAGRDFNETLNLVRYRPHVGALAPDSLRKVLETLREDHYLVRSGERWSFKLDIVRRWWAHRRGGGA